MEVRRGVSGDPLPHPATWQLAPGMWLAALTAGKPLDASLTTASVDLARGKIYFQSSSPGHTFPRHLPPHSQDCLLQILLFSGPSPAHLFSMTPPCLPTCCCTPSAFFIKPYLPRQLYICLAVLAPTGSLPSTWHSTHMAREFLPLSPIYPPSPIYSHFLQGPAQCLQLL